MYGRLMVGAVCAGLAAVVLSPLAFATAREDYRVSQGATADTTDVLEARGYFFEEWIGDDYVEMTWANGTLCVDINGTPLTIKEQTFESTDPEVIAFTAYNGALKGWLFLDEFNEVLVELEAFDSRAIYQTLAPGASEVLLGTACLCRKPGFPKLGCTQSMCDNGEACPQDTSHSCNEKYVSIEEFEWNFNAVTP